MKFLKQSQLNGRNLKDQSVSIVTDGPNRAWTSSAPGAVYRDARIIFDNSNSLQLPKGTTNDRPSGSAVTNGIMRYNTITNEIEVRSAGVWKRLAYKEPNTIEVQTGPAGGGQPWVGDSLDGGTTGEIYFGPLGYSDIDGNPDDLYSAKTSFNISAPQNIMVYVENVPQLPDVNYILEELDGTETGPGYPGAPYPPGVYVKFNGAVPYGKPVTVIHGFDR